MQAILKLIFAVLTLRVVAAHTVFTTLYVDGVSQGDATCIRLNQNQTDVSSPVRDVSSNDMACGIMGETGVSRVCSAGQGSRLTFQFKMWADGSQPGVIADGHKGPCAVYMKAVDSAISDPGYGDGWFKIWDAGYDSNTEEWCTTKLIADDGYLSVDIPQDLAGGYYLVRPELLALHDANASPPDPQFYIGCAQIFLNSSATTSPTSTVSIPGYIEEGDPATTFDIYTPVWPYPALGPDPYENGTDVDPNIPQIWDKRSEHVQTEGLAPEGCILTNGNWCGMEIASYDTETDCWNASNACWDQDGYCWNSTVTGAKNCPIWEDYCYSIQGACNVSDFHGPPTSGVDLNPAPVTLDFASSYTASSAALTTSSSKTSTDYADNTSSDTYTIVASSSTKPTSSQAMTTLATSSRHPSSSAVDSTTEVDVVTVTVYHTVTAGYVPTLGGYRKRAESSSSTDRTVTVYKTFTTHLVSASTKTGVRPSSSNPTPESTISKSTLTVTRTTTAYANLPSTVTNSTGTGGVGTNQTLPISLDGHCGNSTAQTCSGSMFGNCCSKWGYCGLTDDYCGSGCQSGFGTCGGNGTSNVNGTASLRPLGRAQL